MKARADQKCIFITGAASGIGLETARLFAEDGWFVGGYDVDKQGLDALEKELGAENCTTRVLDVCDRADYTVALAEFSTATGGRLDLLFNNAGIVRLGPIDEKSYEELMATVNVNFVGVINGIYLALDLLKATPNSLCFSTASAASIYSMPGNAIYGATKHAVRGLTESLSIELSRFDIRVADVFPGLIDTVIIKDEWREEAPSEGMFRLIQPVEVANAVWASYHDNPERLHWYVPEELREFDKASASDPEGTRDMVAENAPSW